MVGRARKLQRFPDPALLRRRRLYRHGGPLGSGGRDGAGLRGDPRGGVRRLGRGLALHDRHACGGARTGRGAPPEGGRMSLTLRVTTPLAAVLEEEGLASIRAEDASGGFGLPARACRSADGDRGGGAALSPPRGALALLRDPGGVLRATGGRLVTVACREAVPGEDLARLEAGLKRQAEAADQAAPRPGRAGAPPCQCDPQPDAPPRPRAGRRPFRHRGGLRMTGPGPGSAPPGAGPGPDPAAAPAISPPAPPGPPRIRSRRPSGAAPSAPRRGGAIPSPRSRAASARSGCWDG